MQGRARHVSLTALGICHASPSTTPPLSASAQPTCTAPSHLTPSYTYEIHTLKIHTPTCPAPQLRRYELVIQLSEEGAALSTREMRSSSRDTIKEFEQDMALATALAQVGEGPQFLLLLLLLLLLRELACRAACRSSTSGRSS